LPGREEIDRGSVTVLQHYGYRIYTAGSGLDALRVWGKHAGEIDLVLTDMVMPNGLSGGELAERLQAENPRLKVIYSSGYSLELLAGKGGLHKTAHFLPKPYTPQKLAQVVRDCLTPGNPLPALG
jgi:CheY-like chemotaxis protein